MLWFKFFPDEFLADPRIKALPKQERHELVVLMCLCSSQSPRDNGFIKYSSDREQNDQLIATALEISPDEWAERKKK